MAPTPALTLCFIIPGSEYFYGIEEYFGVFSASSNFTGKVNMNDQSLKISIQYINNRE